MRSTHDHDAAHLFLCFGVIDVTIMGAFEGLDPQIGVPQKISFIPAPGPHINPGHYWKK